MAKRSDRSGPAKAAARRAVLAASKPTSARRATSAASPRRKGSRGRAAPTHRAVLIVIVPHRAALEALGPLLIDLGVQATVLAGRGLTAVLADRLPFFGGLAALLPSGADATVVLSITDAGLAKQVAHAVERGEAGGGVIAAAIAVDVGGSSSPSA